MPSLDSYDEELQIQQGPLDLLPPQQMSYSLGASNVTSNTPGAKEMSAAYNISKQLVCERMERENPEDVAILNSVAESDIVCVQGTYDHIHLVLNAIGVPFAHVTPTQL